MTIENNKHNPPKLVTQAGLQQLWSDCDLSKLILSKLILSKLICIEVSSIRIPGYIDITESSGNKAYESKVLWELQTPALGW